MRIAVGSIVVLCIGVLCPSLSQTLTSSPGELDGLAVGGTYTLDADPEVGITPNYYDETGTPAEFVLRADAGSQWVVSFILPATLLGSDTLRCEFSDSSAFLLSGGGYWDPHEARTLTAAWNSTIDLTLGITVHVPLYPVRGDRYSGKIICRAMRVTDGYALTDTSEYAAVSECGVGGVQYADGQLCNLAAGPSYTLSPGTSGIMPIVTGKEKGSAMVNPVSCLDSGMVLSVTFMLPDSLVCRGLPSIPCSFGPGSALDRSTGERWDPHVAHTVRLDSIGSSVFELGITVSVPESAQSGYYLGRVMWTMSSQAGGGGTTYWTIPQFFEALVTGPAIPQSFSLSQNYPNPFNGTTTIMYDLTVRSDVKLTLVNILGEAVRVLVDEVHDAGTHSIRVDSDNLPSGIYFYRIVAGPFTATRAMCIVR